MTNVTTLHKLSEAFAEIDDAEQSLETFWHNYHVYIIVAIVVAIVTIFIHCCVKPIYLCVKCFLCDCCCCLCHSQSSHTRLRDSEC